MSLRPSHRVRRAAALGALLAAALPPATALADSDSTLDLQCRFPGAGLQSVHLDLHTVHPASALYGGSNTVNGERVDISMAIPGLAGAVDASTPVARLSVGIDLTSGASTLGPDGPGDVAGTPWTDTGSGQTTSEAINGGANVPLQLTVPSVFRMEAKTYGIATGASFRLRAFSAGGEEVPLPAPTLDADGQPIDGAPGQVPCSTRDRTGLLWVVKGAAFLPPFTVQPTVDAIGSTTATVAFGSTRGTSPDGRVHHYFVAIEDAATRTRIAGAEIPEGVGTFAVTGLEAGREYRAVLSASVPETAEYAAQSVGSTFTTFTTAQRPVYPSTWSASGLLTLARGSAPVTGTLAGLDLGAPSGSGGALTLRLTQARLTAPGGLPVTASLALVPSGGASFTAGQGAQRTITQMVRVKLSQAKLFGSIPLVLGTTCQAKSLSTLSLNGEITPGGGTLTAPLTIPALTGCGPFTSVLSSLIAGTTKGITLTLAPTPPPAPAAS